MKNAIFGEEALRWIPGNLIHKGLIGAGRCRQQVEVRGYRSVRHFAKRPTHQEQKEVRNPVGCRGVVRRRRAGIVGPKRLGFERGRQCESLLDSCWIEKLNAMWCQTLLATAPHKDIDLCSLNAITCLLRGGTRWTGTNHVFTELNPQNPIWRETR